LQELFVAGYGPIGRVECLLEFFRYWEAALEEFEGVDLNPR
jgi:hypothetical protein